ncbi:MAG: acetylornithine deacetylase/succinyl-diaminopimelate desuccinylase family protein [Pseudomonadales bacterium]|nr:acetylornithine deacetylase/succinyl-diaminopimelate desuccinylase family protein [Pseudomonadales bacterium]MCP5183862.1 acetylornithine deacetylase/succinyl-diaminopimelate desuccinylase family protein [Pseudomonadales bacterium]
MIDRLLQQVEARRDDLVEFTRELVRIPTVNPPGDNYRDCAELLGRRLAAHGFEVRLLRALGTPGDSDRYPRYNLIARRTGTRSGPRIHFNGHIDVVEPGLGWTVDPFAATVADGRVYGRGTCDMKGGIAAAVIAVEALLACCPDLPGSIEISGTADEESGGYGGVAWLCEQGLLTRDTADHVIIPEPLNKDRVCLGHRGVWWAEIETFGRIAHGSMPFLGDSAIRHMGAVLDAFEGELFPLLATKRTGMPVVPEGARQSTLNINSVHGGQSEGHDGLPSPLVADSCRLIIDRRFLIEEPIAEVKSEVTRLLERLAATRAGFRFALRDLFEVLPTLTDRNAPVVRGVAQAIQQVLGREPDYVVSPGTYDQKHVDRIGRLHNCIAYGPGILDLAHRPDEYVDIQDLEDAAKVMAVATWHLLTGSAA